MFTRLMRDIGFDFYWYDLYTENQLSMGFEADLKNRYEALTIFEGFEHFENPHKDFKKIFDLSDTIIITTTLIPKPTPQPNQWWYYGLEHGQHIAFYSQETFKYIGKKYKYNYLTNGKYIHILTKKHISNILLKFLLSPFGLVLLPIVFFTNKPKTISDSRRF